MPKDDDKGAPDWATLQRKIADQAEPAKKAFLAREFREGRKFRCNLMVVARVKRLIPIVPKGVVMALRNAFYAQSGGVTAVINATACGVLQTARQHPGQIGKVYAGRDGIIGALTEDLIDTSVEPEAAIEALKYTPGGAFGSCRYKLGSVQENRTQYERLIEVFRAHDIGFFFYNGGGDSQDTAYKVSQMVGELDYSLVCIGIPKTMDNDLPITDCSPGFGSVAKYVATSIREVAFDLAAMSRTSTKVFVLEVMGRHAGWTTAACALAAEREGDAPHILLLPEVAFDEERFLAKVREALTGTANAPSPYRRGSRDRTVRSSRSSGWQTPSAMLNWAGSRLSSPTLSVRSLAASAIGRPRLPPPVGTSYCLRDRFLQAYAVGRAAVSLRSPAEAR